MHILTFDIEDWFHTHQNRKHYSGHVWAHLPSRIEENTARILRMLDDLKLKATFFILGWEAAQHPQIVRQIQHQGHEIGAHSHWHHHANLLSPGDFEKDLILCVDTLQDITGEPVICHRAPGFSLRLSDQWAFEILAAHGILYDSSVKLRNTGQNLPLVIETRAGLLTEYPLLETRLGIPFTGGGFFRNLPDEAFNLLFDPPPPYVMYYFHPRDFDPGYPYSNLFSFFRNWLNKRNTDLCLQRLIPVLEKYPTMPLIQANRHKIANTQGT